MEDEVEARAAAVVAAVDGGDVAPEALEVSEIRRAEVVHHGEPRLRPAALELEGEVRADEACPARDEDLARVAAAFGRHGGAL